MMFDTNAKSVWLDHEDRMKLSAKLNQKYEGVAPTIYWDRMQAAKKVLKIKKITDLAYGDNLRHDSVLYTLYHAAKDEHNLICSNYEWMDYKTNEPKEVTEENNRRLDEAGLYASELDTIADLKKLPKGTILYEVPHNNKNKNYITFFVIVDGKPYNVALKCLGFKYGVLDANPYHNFHDMLGRKLFDDEDWFKRGFV